MLPWLQIILWLLPFWNAWRLGRIDTSGMTNSQKLSVKISLTLNLIGIVLVTVAAFVYVNKCGIHAIGTSRLVIRVSSRGGLETLRS